MAHVGCAVESNRVKGIVVLEIELHAHNRERHLPALRRLGHRREDVIQRQDCKLAGPPPCIVDERHGNAALQHEVDTKQQLLLGLGRGEAIQRTQVRRVVGCTRAAKGSVGKREVMCTELVMWGCWSHARRKTIKEVERSRGREVERSRGRERGREVERSRGREVERSRERERERERESVCVCVCVLGRAPRQPLLHPLRAWPVLRGARRRSVGPRVVSAPVPSPVSPLSALIPAPAPAPAPAPLHVPALAPSPAPDIITITATIAAVVIGITMAAVGVAVAITTTGVARWQW